MKEEEEGFHVICGTGSKNGITGQICGSGSFTGDITKSAGVLDLSGLKNLLIADLDYFIKHHEEILEMAREKQYNRLKYKMMNREFTKTDVKRMRDDGLEIGGD